MKAIWPTLFAICTAFLCLGLLEVSLDMRGAVRFVRPYHYTGTLITVLVVVSIFWPLYRTVGWLRRRGAFLLSISFLVLLLSAWAITLPLGDRIAIHSQRLDPLYSSGPWDGSFYKDDSGMDQWPMSIGQLIRSIFRPWMPVMFLAFFPWFFYFHRNSNEPGNA